MILIKLKILTIQISLILIIIKQTLIIIIRQTHSIRKPKTPLNSTLANKPSIKHSIPSIPLLGSLHLSHPKSTASQQVEFSFNSLPRYSSSLMTIGTISTIKTLMNSWKSCLIFLSSCMSLMKKGSSLIISRLKTLSK